MREHITSRRAVIKAAGALGTITALAVPVAVLPKAEAAEQVDAELLQLYAEWERHAAALDAEQVRNAPTRVEWDSLYSQWRAENPTAPLADFLSHPAAVAHDAAFLREGVLFDAMNTTADQIHQLPAKTLAGLAVKARLAGEELEDILAAPRAAAVEEWQRARVMSFFLDVERLEKEAAHV